MNLDLDLPEGTSSGKATVTGTRVAALWDRLARLAAGSRAGMPHREPPLTHRRSRLALSLLASATAAIETPGCRQAATT